MINKKARKKLYSLLDCYCSGLINNDQLYDFAAYFYRSNDALVSTISKATDSLYDDNTEHWWFKYYNKQIQDTINSWKIMLNSDFDLAIEAKREKECFKHLLRKSDDTINNTKLKVIDSNFKVYAPINYHTLIAMYKKYHFGLIVKRKIISILKVRNLEECEATWSRYGCISIYKGLPSHLKKILPYDCGEITNILSLKPYKSKVIIAKHVWRLLSCNKQKIL